MLIINKKDIETVYSMTEAIAACKEALRMYSTGSVQVPLRINFQSENGANLFMPAYVKETNSTGIKIVSTFPKNTEIGKPTVPAQMIMLDKESGEVSSIIDGTYLTQLRTGAVQGAATDLLARKDAKFGVLIGAGGQAASQLEAMLTVRNLEQVIVIDLNETLLNKFVSEMNEKFDVKIVACVDAKEAIKNADIITTVTTAPGPVFDASELKPGVHINGIGSYTLDMKEIPKEAIINADIRTVDTFNGVFAEAGDVMFAIEQSNLTESSFSELGELILDPSKGRQNDSQITFFKSVGSAVLDVVVGQAIFEKATKENMGTLIEL